MIVCLLPVTPFDISNATYLIVASSDYLYTPCSLFWPVEIFLLAPKLDWGQAVDMAISVLRTVSIDPQVIVVAGSKDFLQNIGLLTRLSDGSFPSIEVIGEAIMTLFSAMTEVETLVQPCFYQERGEDCFCFITSVCCIARTIAVCVHDGHHISRGTIRRGHSRAEQNCRSQ